MLIVTLASSAQAAAPSPAALYPNAQADAQGALTNAALLASAAQARLKKIQWDFSAAGNKKAQREADDLFGEVSERLAQFRGVAELAAKETDPMADKLAALEGSAKVQEAAMAPKPNSDAGLVEELLKLRAAYDADKARMSLIRAESSYQQLSAQWGESELLPPQERALFHGEDLLAALFVTRGKLWAAAASLTGKESPKQMAALDRVEAHLKGLDADSEALGVELRRLRLKFRLDNYSNRKEPAKP